ncbi:MAG: MogA/MoaB family molybdenum cofactor biosynthesis protein [Alphaproteobacteria bacterium]|nr:MogA/MoaB family molybdenum cofactor biosynthesis protein [Alphaproteobacteria bacterium]
MGGHREGHGGAVDVAVLVVSSTRTVADDGGGTVIAERLTAAGHRAISRSVVGDEVEAIRRAVRKAVEDGVPAVILTGGTGMAPSDVTPEALAPLFTRRLDGFGELFRMLSFDEVGAAAMLSRAVAGVVGKTPVFAVPGSPAACRLAVDRLIAPELSHLVGLLRAGAATRAAVPTLDEPTAELEIVTEEQPAAVPPVSVPAAPTGGRTGVDMRHKGEEQAPPAGDDGPWQRRIKELGGTVHLDRREPFPDEVERMAPVVDVLVGAGDVGTLTLEDGRTYSIWGFPDLRRPSSKVLVLREGWPLCEIVALHRLATGTTVAGDGGLVASRGADVAEVATAVVGRPPPGDEPGELFAVAGDSIYLERDGKVSRWDGHKEHPLGTTRQALASLVLEWSRR